jgi:hypothetical protein
MIHEVIAVVKAINGQRDHERSELKSLLLIVGRWIMEAPFLCEDEEIIAPLTVIMQKLVWFPIEALNFIPAFQNVASAFRESFKIVGCCGN